MRSASVVTLMLLFVGCAITPEQAVSIARREVERRNLPLPNHYVTTITLSELIEEFELPHRELWYVTFTRPGAKKPLYEVTVDKYNHTIESFTDDSKLVPSEAVPLPTSGEHRGLTRRCIQPLAGVLTRFTL
jgi:hypothetical protein